MISTRVLTEPMKVITNLECILTGIVLVLLVNYLIYLLYKLFGAECPAN